MEDQNKNIKGKEKFVDKSVHQTYHDGKPVGYGSSIQNSGHGNRTRPKDADEANQYSQEEKKDQQ